MIFDLLEVLVGREKCPVENKLFCDWRKGRKKEDALIYRLVVLWEGVMSSLGFCVC